MRQKSTGLILCDLHGQNRLQSVMTETHADNGGTKVVDQLLIDISTGDFSVLDSQTSARDKTQTIESGESASRKKSTNEGRVPFDQNFRKFRFKIEWNRHFPEIRFQNFGSPL